MAVRNRNPVCCGGGPSTLLLVEFPSASDGNTVPGFRKPQNITDAEVSEALSCGQKLQLVEKKTKGSRQILSLRKKRCG